MGVCGGHWVIAKEVQRQQRISIKKILFELVRMASF